MAGCAAQDFREDGQNAVRHLQLQVGPGWRGSAHADRLDHSLLLLGPGWPGSAYAR